MKLYKACKNGDYNHVNDLLNKKRIGSNSSYYKNGLLLSCENQRYDIIQLFFCRDPNIFLQDMSIWNILKNSQRIDLIRTFLKEIKSMLTDDKYRQFLSDVLCIVCSGSSCEFASLLITEGANVNTKTGFPLSVACEKGSVEMVKLLLDSGANQRERHLYKACQREYEFVRLLLEYGANVHTNNNKALRIACGMNDEKIVRLLLENGADVHANDDYPFGQAVAYNNVSMIKLLCEYGVDMKLALSLPDYCCNSVFDVVRFFYAHNLNVLLKPDSEFCDKHYIVSVRKFVFYIPNLSCFFGCVENEKYLDFYSL